MQSNSLRYVACVSYPRSGHHLTVSVLRRYFSDAFTYCQFYQKPDCETDCCQTFPCTNAAVTMTKNHDMDIARDGQDGIPRDPSVPYLVLVRNFLEAVVSDYNLFLRNHEDSQATWHSFATRKSDYYRRFVGKWIAAGDDLDKLVVHYEDLTQRPHEMFRQIAGFFEPTEAIDDERLGRVITASHLSDITPTGTKLIRKFGVKNRRRIEDFHHYDETFFAQLEAGVADVLSSQGYALRFQQASRQAS